VAELLTLTSPIVRPSITTYRVDSLNLHLSGEKYTVGFLGTNGETLSYSVVGSTAKSRMVALNKVNLSVKSLERRILEFAVTDGILAGAISGSPD
jgi:hypothetical protein